MPTHQSPERVGFLTIEGGTDLIVAFAIEGDEPGEVLSLILQRTPKYEGLLPPEERGVRVSHERYPEHDEDFLRRVGLAGGLVAVETTSTRYRLDVSRVDPAELRRARRLLERMNFDGQFALERARALLRRWQTSTGGPTRDISPPKVGRLTVRTNVRARPAETWRSVLDMPKINEVVQVGR